MADRIDPAREPGEWEGPGAGGDEAFPLPPFLFDPFGVLRRRWIWMLAALLLGLVGAAVLTYTDEPTYLATSTLLISRQQIPEEFVRSTVREDAIANINSMVGQILSRENLERVVRQLGLVEARGPRASMAEVVGELAAGIETGTPEGYRRHQNESSIIYGVSYRSKDPEESAKVADALAALLIEASLERRSLLARRTTDFLRRQLGRDEGEFRSQSQAIAEFRRSNRGVLPSELETSLRRLDLLAERRRSITAQIESTESRMLARAAQPLRGDESESQILLEELRRQLARESAVHTDAHPNVSALRARIERLAEIVEAEDPAIAASPAAAADRRELEQLKRELDDTDRLIAELDVRVDETPMVAEQLEALEQKEHVLRERYLDSLRKVEQAELAETLESAQQGSQVSVLDAARVPTSPERPRWVLAAAGVGLALGFALAVGVLLELLDPVVLNVAQLDRLAGQPCLGGVPESA